VRWKTRCNQEECVEHDKHHCKLDVCWIRATLETQVERLVLLNISDLVSPVPASIERRLNL
jgi:hypothetical protein